MAILYHDYAARELISDIAPVEAVDIPYTMTSGNFWGTTATAENPITIYKSAWCNYIDGSNDYGIVVALFNGEPTLSGRYGDSATKVNYSGNLWYVYFSRTSRGTDATSDLIKFTDLNAWKEYIFSPMQPAYNWQSVPSISGKNGILSLAQIKEEYINDGESVSGASADHFANLSTENRVDVLIDAALPAPETGGTTVTVKYTIPNLSIGSYEYCKLVAKKNSMPESVEDGDKIINIDPSLASAVVRGLDELSTYYFTIFIEDEQSNTASSEPKNCKTGIGSNWRNLASIKVNGINCPLLQINDFSIIPNAYAGAETLIRRQSGIYIPSGVSDLGSEFAQPTISSGTVEKSTNYNNVIFRTTFGYSSQAYSNFNQNEIIYNTNTVLMSHGFLLATEANTRLYIGIALNDAERYGCCYFVAQYPDRNWTTENYSGGDGEIGYLIYSIFGNS